MESRLHGTACVKCGRRDLGAIGYHVEVSAGGHASIVKFERRPNAKGGDHLHLTLEDGRMLDCEVLDASSYCAVVGDGPYYDRRALERPT
jgi:hypothetical protein